MTNCFLIIIDSIQAGGISTLGLGPLYLIGLLLPGLIFYKCFIRRYDRYDTLSRIDKIGAALLGGLITGWLLVIGLGLFGIGPIYFAQKNELTLTHASSAILVQILIAVVLGTILGGVPGFVQGTGKSNFSNREQPWDYTTSRIEDSWVTVITRSNDQPIHGVVARTTSGFKEGSIVLVPLSEESKITADTKADHDENNTLFISKDDILRIYYHEDSGDDDYFETLARGEVDMPPEDEATDEETDEDEGE
jgi:hypothetical protein